MIARTPHLFSVSDRVAYSAGFLRSIGAFTGDMPFLRGAVRETNDFGDDRQMCVIEWDNYRVEFHDDGFARVLNVNLTLESRIAFDAA